LNYVAIMSAAYLSQMANQISCGVNGTVPDSFDWSSDTTNTVYINAMASQGCVSGDTALDPMSAAPSFTFCLLLSLALTMTTSLQTASPLIVQAAQPLSILTISLT
jgi:hypothetical protein